MIVYQLNFEFKDSLELIRPDLSNIQFSQVFEYGGCIVAWGPSVSPKWFSYVPAEIKGNMVHVPHVIALGNPVNCNWAKIFVRFVDPVSKQRISNTIEFNIIRGSNYP
jgi:hypothetical protein